MITLKRAIIIHTLIFLSGKASFAINNCSPLSDRPDSQSTYRSVQFPKWQDLTPIQQKLLLPYLVQQLIPYEQWIAESDGHASAFFAITKAHEVTELFLAKGTSISSLEMFLGILEIHGDRMVVQMDRFLVEHWKSYGGQFAIHKADGNIEKDKINFNTGNAGGSLHCGYDFQGYTSVTKVPRLQWNYNNFEATADLDIDGYAPWIGGFIPNPNHMTWENSDVRYWFSDFKSKYGNPGFATVLR